MNIVKDAFDALSDSSIDALGQLSKPIMDIYTNIVSNRHYSRPALMNAIMQARNPQKHGFDNFLVFPYWEAQRRSKTSELYGHIKNYDMQSVKEILIDEIDKDNGDLIKLANIVLLHHASTKAIRPKLGAFIGLQSVVSKIADSDFELSGSESISFQIIIEMVKDETAYYHEMVYYLSNEDLGLFYKSPSACLENKAPDFTTSDKRSADYSSAAFHCKLNGVLAALVA